MEKRERKIRLFKKHSAFIAGLLLYFGGMTLLFKSVCPMRLMLHVPCPFCGMTRAHLALLHLDLQAAFACHPMFFLGVPFLLLCIHLPPLQKRFKLVPKILVFLLAALFLLVYILRIVGVLPPLV